MDKKTNKKKVDHHYVLFTLLILVLVILLIYFFVDFKFLSSGKEKLSLHDVLVSENISRCSDLDDNNLIESCKVKLSVCSTDDCFYKKARAEQDEMICFNIEDEQLRVTCSSAATYDSIIQTAVIGDDISLCKDFEDEKYVTICQDNFYFVSSVNKNNKELCYEITNEVSRNECLE